MTERLRVAFAAAECSPWCSSGGLGEVAAALPKALAAEGMDVAAFFPLYREARQQLRERGAQLHDAGTRTHVQVGAHRLTARLWRVIPKEPVTIPAEDQADPAPEQRGPGRLVTYAVDCPALFEREGMYGHHDDAARFSFFTRAVLQSASALLGGPPHILHSHDWHTALAPIYLEGPYKNALPRTASVVTIHNLAFQGVFSADELGPAGLSAQSFHPERLEYWGRVNWLKGGIAAADAITTVSRRYAEEIRTPEYGERLEGVLRQHERRLYGILNGIDTDAWNPATDPDLPGHYSRGNMAGKAACRAHVLQMCRMDPADRHPVFGVVSRLTRQKGLDMVADLLPWLASRSVRTVLLGTGEPGLEQRFAELERQFWPWLRIELRFDRKLSHQLQAGVDAMLMPSRYEPCGLTQLYAMRYGTVPIVRATGGLFDTVVHAFPSAIADGTATGFSFEGADTAGLQWAADRALDVYYTQPDAWQRIVDNGMRQDFSWARSAEQYVWVYKRALERRRARFG